MNNKGADQTARMRRLVCAFVVRKHQRQVFLRRDPNKIYNINNYELSISYFNVFRNFIRVYIIIHYIPNSVMVLIFVNK